MSFRIHDRKICWLLSSKEYYLLSPNDSRVCVCKALPYNIRAIPPTLWKDKQTCQLRKSKKSYISAKKREIVFWINHTYESVSWYGDIHLFGIIELLHSTEIDYQSNDIAKKPCRMSVSLFRSDWSNWDDRYQAGNP